MTPPISIKDASASLASYPKEGQLKLLLRDDAEESPPVINLDDEKFRKLILASAAKGSSIKTRASLWGLSPWQLSPLAFFSLTACSDQGCSGNKCSGGSSIQENQAPEFSYVPNYPKARVNEELNFRVQFTDPDGWDNLKLRMEPSVSAFPLGAQLFKQTQTIYQFAWTPRKGQEGWYSAKFVVSDGELEAQKVVTFQVLGLEGSDKDAGTDVSDSGSNNGSGKVDAGTDGRISAGVDAGRDARDSGSNSDSGTKDAVGPTELSCIPSGKGLGIGTPEDPFTFRVLFVMEESTRTAIEAEGWSIEAGMDRMISKLNEGYNNGQLAGHYRFTPIGVRYEPKWENTNHINTSQTPEDDDLILAFDPDKGTGGGVYNSSGKTIVFGGIYLFDPNQNMFILNHEVGHFRSAIDLYAVGLSPQENQIFPGAGHFIEENSYMQGNNKFAVPNWDALSAGLINAAGGDPQLDTYCSYQWLQKWVPKNLSLRVINQDGKPIPGAPVKIYRDRFASTNPLTESALWYSGTSDTSGIIKLSEGITVPDIGSGFNDVILGAIEYNGESYLNWYDNRNFLLPYLEGKTDLILDAKMDETTRYQKPKYTDLETLSLEVSSTTPAVQEFIDRTFVVRNNGPETLTGNISHQFLLSKDLNFQLYSADIANGGNTYLVNLAPGETKTIQISNWIPPTVTPGVYYLQVNVFLRDEGYWDPNENNNAAVSVPITVTAP